jgi:hypothetical protein
MLNLMLAIIMEAYMAGEDEETKLLETQLMEEKDLLESRIIETKTLKDKLKKENTLSKLANTKSQLFGTLKSESFSPVNKPD